MCASFFDYTAILFFDKLLSYHCIWSNACASSLSLLHTSCGFFTNSLMGCLFSIAVKKNIRPLNYHTFTTIELFTRTAMIVIMWPKNVLSQHTHTHIWHSMRQSYDVNCILIIKRKMRKVTSKNHHST